MAITGKKKRILKIEFLAEIPDNFSNETLKLTREIAIEEAEKIILLKVKKTEEIIAEAEENLEKARELFKREKGIDARVKMLFNKACTSFSAVGDLKRSAKIMEEVAILYSRSKQIILAIFLANNAKESFEKISGLDGQKGIVRMKKLIKKLEKKLKKYRKAKEKELEKEKGIREKVRLFEKNLREAKEK